LPVLEEGKPARTVSVKDEEKKLFKQLSLLTSKPVFYVCNLAEDDVLSGNEFSRKVEEYAKAEGAKAVNISAKIEAEIALLEGEAEKKEFLDTIGLKETGLDRIAKTGYELLNLVTYFTAGPKETRAWTIHKGDTAPQAAGVIHTDFEKGFIRAAVISYEDYVKFNGEEGVKNAGKLRVEGKDYIVQDGDVCHFRFNV
jgi:GTP-binding protein YchF